MYIVVGFKTKKQFVWNLNIQKCQRMHTLKVTPTDISPV